VFQSNISRRVAGLFFPHSPFTSYKTPIKTAAAAEIGRVRMRRDEVVE